MSFKDHFSGHADDYAQFRPNYPASLFEYLANQCEKRELAWDCATGNGQAAKSLSRYFAKVLASDGSANQIANAVSAENVEYRVAEATASGLTDESVDLVTVAQAVHWFPFEAFFAEVDRVLKPGGIVAIWGYGLGTCGRPLDELVKTFYEAEVGSYWPPERHFIDTQYKTISFPFEKLAHPKFEMVSMRTVDQLLGYLRTWSASKRFEAERGFDPVSLIQGQMRELWPEDEPTLGFKSDLFMLLGQKA